MENEMSKIGKVEKQVRTNETKSVFVALLLYWLLSTVLIALVSGLSVLLFFDVSDVRSIEGSIYAIGSVTHAVAALLFLVYCARAGHEIACIGSVDWTLWGIALCIGAVCGVASASLVGGDLISTFPSVADEVVNTVFSVLVNPVLEEMVFTGFVFSNIRRTRGLGFSLVSVSAVFSAMHVDTLLSIYAFLSVAVLCCLTCLAFEKCKKLGPSIMIHIGWNLANVEITTTTT